MNVESDRQARIQELEDQVAELTVDLDAQTVRLSDVLDENGRLRRHNEQLGMAVENLVSVASNLTEALKRSL